MKVLISLISIGMGIIFLGEGCSKDEEAPIPESGPRVVKRIITPAPKMTKNPIRKDEERVKPEENETPNRIQVVVKGEAIKPPVSEPLKTPEEPY